MKTVLVLGAGGPAGINFIESLLLTKDYNVIGCDVNPWHLKLIERRFDIKTYRVDYLTSQDARRVADLNWVMRKESVDFVHAQPDFEVEFLSRNREKINAVTFLPSKGTIEACRNKYTTAVLMRGLAPLTSLVNENTLASQIKMIQDVSEEKRVWLRAVRGAGSKAALPITTLRQALDWIHYWKETKRLESSDFMVSEFLPGKEYAFQSVWLNGELITSMARERMEYLMGNLFPSGQSSSPSVAVTVHHDRVNVIATQAMWNIDKRAHGIFCIDMKENKYGMPLVTEINAGRFFTTSNFFSHYGANMPDTYIKLGFGESVGELPKYNAIPKDIVWVRGIDTLPYGFEL
jgi:carbamoyl-phosphate synthase large subunit